MKTEIKQHQVFKCPKCFYMYRVEDKVYDELVKKIDEHKSVGKAREEELKRLITIQTILPSMKAQLVLNIC
jgi:DNA-directed RNA polymerase subunit M/transcription elongation factor TFIIS